MLQTINARDLLRFTPEQLFDILTGTFLLRFDDGTIETDARSTIYSSYYWAFHKEFPDTPLLAKHHIKTVLNGMRLSVDADLRLLGNAMWTVKDAYPLDANVTMDRLTRLAYVTDNAAYNSLIERTEEYVTSIDILDIMEVLDEDDIFNANRNVKTTKESIELTRNIISKVLSDPKKLKRNIVAGNYRSRLINPGQVLQCVGPRGAPTDMGSRIFANPVTRGYAEGLRTIHDSMIESRSAAKSSFFAGDMLEDTEYFSRRLQFIAQNVQHIHSGDCGAKEYLPWKIRGAGHIGKNSPSDLKLLHGKYYMNESTGKLEMITPKRLDLVGKTINLRSSIYCAHPDPVGICATCFGELYFSVPPETNIGQLCATYMAKQSTQNLLSNKHLDMHATLDSITLSAEDAKCLTVGNDNSSYLLSKNLLGSKVSMVIPSKQCESLMDIFEVPNVEQLNLRHISELEDIGFRFFDGKIEDGKNIRVVVNKRFGSFTYDMLNYIRTHSWTVDKLGDYVVDLFEWDWDKTIITLPQKHFNMSDHADEIANKLESRVTQIKLRDKGVNPDVLVKEFFDYVNWKLEVNLAAIEVILYSTMIVSAENGDYSLPKPWTDRGFGVHLKTMANRSASVSMAYEHQIKRIMSLDSYLQTNILDHVFDALICPHEVLET